MKLYLEDATARNIDNTKTIFENAIFVNKHCPEKILGSSILFGQLPPILWCSAIGNVDNHTEYYQLIYDNMKILYGEKCPQTYFWLLKLAKSYVSANQKGRALELYEHTLLGYQDLADYPIERFVFDENCRFCKEALDQLYSNHRLELLKYLPKLH